MSTLLEIIVASLLRGGITEAEWGLIKDFKVLHQSLLESVDANSFSESLSICFFFDWRIYLVTLFRNRLYLFVSSLVLVRLALLNNHRLFLINLRILESSQGGSEVRIVASLLGICFSAIVLMSP